MIINFDNQKVLITGGSRGIGKEIALAFLNSKKCYVVITGQSEKTPEWAQKLIDNSYNLEYLQLNFLDANWNLILGNILNKYDGFDVCINNAGINSIHHITEFPVEKIEQILMVNLQVPIILTGMVAKKMIKKGYGRIINIASVFGVISKEKRSAYTASKSGLIGLTKTMALELAKHNILVNALSPGFIKTDLTKEVLGKEGITEMQKRIPLNRLGQPEEIAKYVLFFASRQNTYMTGQNVIIDGGFISG